MAKSSNNHKNKVKYELPKRTIKALKISKIYPFKKCIHALKTLKKNSLKNDFVKLSQFFHRTKIDR